MLRSALDGKPEIARHCTTHPHRNAHPLRLRTRHQRGLQATHVDCDEVMVRDRTDCKALIAKAADTAEKLALAQKLATRRLANGVLPELDACFAALHLETVAALLSAV